MIKFFNCGYTVAILFQAPDLDGFGAFVVYVIPYFAMKEGITNG